MYFQHVRALNAAECHGIEIAVAPIAEDNKGRCFICNENYSRLQLRRDAYSVILSISTAPTCQSSGKYWHNRTFTTLLLTLPNITTGMLLRRSRAVFNSGVHCASRRICIINRNCVDSDEAGGSWVLCGLEGAVLETRRETRRRKPNTWCRTAVQAPLWSLFTRRRIGEVSRRRMCQNTGVEVNKIMERVINLMS